MNRRTVPVRSAGSGVPGRPAIMGRRGLRMRAGGRDLRMDISLGRWRGPGGCGLPRPCGCTGGRDFPGWQACADAAGVCCVARGKAGDWRRRAAVMRGRCAQCDVGHFLEPGGQLTGVGGGGTHDGDRGGDRDGQLGDHAQDVRQHSAASARRAGGQHERRDVSRLVGQFPVGGRAGGIGQGRWPASSPPRDGPASRRQSW